MFFEIMQDLDEEKVVFEKMEVAVYFLDSYKFRLENLHKFNKIALLILSKFCSQNEIKVFHCIF